MVIENLTREEWQQIATKLQAPFPVEDVDWRPSGKAGPNTNSEVVAYIDSRAVADRLDTVVGPGAWSFSWDVISLGPKGDVDLARGTLSIYGVSKSDIGDSSTFSASKGCVSDALKRAAVLWGIGRYLYALPKVWMTLDSRGRIPDAEMKKLRAALARRSPGTATVARMVTDDDPEVAEATTEPQDNTETKESIGYDPWTDEAFKRACHQALEVTDSTAFGKWIGDFRERAEKNHVKFTHDYCMAQTTLEGNLLKACKATSAK